jgi:hypothetical protein
VRPTTKQTTGVNNLSLTELGSKTSPYTPSFTYVKGCYRIGGERLSYLSAAIPFKEANRFLNLARDLIFDPTEVVPLEELMQRELDEKRARSEIVTYLKKPGELKFFNAITVALLPCDPDHHSRLAKTYIPDSNPPNPENPALHTIQVGGIQVSHPPNDDGVGYIRWNTNLLRPVILDGQHRFFSLQELYRDDQYIGKEELGESDLPVLLLILDDRVGFEAGHDSVDLLRTCRRIFIDLNKHAVKVSRVREIILDDRDLTARCMRSLLLESGLEIGRDVQEQLDEVGKLPLAQVDWHSGEAKFRTGIYLTTVMNLYDLTSLALDLPSFKGQNYQEVDEFIDKFCSRLDLPSLRPSLKRRRKEAEDDQLPFELVESDIASAVTRFGETLAPFVVRPLVTLTPYRSFIERAEGLALLAGEYETWAALDKNGKRAYQKAQEVDPSNAAALLSEHKESWELAFQVVYQKAFVRALVEMSIAASEVLPTWGSSEGPEGFIEVWCARFNRLLGPLLSKEHLDVWLGAGRTLEDKIEFTQRGINSIVGFVVTVMLAPIEAWVEAEQPEAVATDWLRKNAWEKIKKGAKVKHEDNLLSKLGRHYRDSLLRIARAEATAQGNDLTDERAFRRASQLGGQKLGYVARQLR